MTVFSSGKIAGHGRATRHASLASPMGRPASSPSPRLALALALGLGLGAGCGGSTSGNTRETTPTTGSTSSTHATGHTTPPETIRGRSAPELAPLRPASVETILTGLDRDPEDANLYSRAAIAYADTDYAGMTLVYGQQYRLLDTHGPRTVDTTNAMARVLREKVVTTPGTTNVVLSLAHGAMPMLATRSGGQMAPFVYLYEHSMARAATLGTTTRENFEGAAAYFAAQLGAVCRSGTPVLEEEFYETLCGISAAGHRDVYAHWVIGPAFAADYERWEASHSAAVNAFQAYLASHRFRPRTPTRADDLFAVRSGND